MMYNHNLSQYLFFFAARPTPGVSHRRPPTDGCDADLHPTRIAWQRLFIGRCQRIVTHVTWVAKSSSPMTWASHTRTWRPMPAIGLGAWSSNAIGRSGSFGAVLRLIRDGIRQHGVGFARIHQCIGCPPGRTPPRFR